MSIWIGTGINAAVAALLLGGSGLPLCGHAVLARAEEKPPAQTTPERVIREIDDPGAGAKWILVPDAAHPGGPARLIQSKLERASTEDKTKDAALSVIHAGDRIIVEEHTAVVDAQLEAVAMGPAQVGSPFQVRLKMGGKVLRAIALAPGRAALAPQPEARR